MFARVGIFDLVPLPKGFLVGDPYVFSKYSFEGRPDPVLLEISNDTPFAMEMRFISNMLRAVVLRFITGCRGICWRTVNLVNVLLLQCI